MDKIKKVATIPGSGGGGYPIKDVGKDGVMVKGSWPPVPQKKYGTMRGAGAATRGTKFLKD